MLGQKTMSGPKYYGYKKKLGYKIFGSNQILEIIKFKKNFGPKKYRVQIDFNVQIPKCVVQKEIWVQKHFGSEKSCVPKQILVSEKCLVHNKLWAPNNLEYKNLWVKIIFGTKKRNLSGKTILIIKIFSKKYCGSRNFWDKNVLGQKNSVASQIKFW